MLGIARNNDVELVRRTLSGQRDAFGLLVDRYLRFAYAIAYARAHSRSDADDVVQDSFLTAFQQLNTLREPARFSAWLATIIRRLSGKSNQRARLAESAESAAAPSELVHPEHEREELRALIRTEVQALDESDREVILLCYFAGKSAGEIAAALESTPAAIRKRLQRAREKLGERLLATLADPRSTEDQKAEQIMGVIGTTTVAWESATSLTAVTSVTTGGGAMAMKIAGLLAGVIAVMSGWSAYNHAQTGKNATSPSESPAHQSAHSETRKLAAAPAEPGTPSTNNTRSVTDKINMIDHSVEGIVLSSDNKPVPGIPVSVRLLPPFDSIWRASTDVALTPSKTVMTDANGIFLALFQDVKRDKTDTYLFAEVFTQTDATCRYALIGIGAAQNILYQLKLLPHSSISGVVRDAAGAPIPNAIVAPHRFEPITGSADTFQYTQKGCTTDKEGRFTLDHLYVGRWKLWARAEGFASTTTTFVETNSELDITLAAGKHYAGQLVDLDTNAPLAKVALRMTPKELGKQEVHDVVTDSKGSFHFTSLRECEYVLTTNDPTRFVSHQQSKVSITANWDDDIVALQRGGSIAGRIIDAETQQGIPGVVPIAQLAGNSEDAHPRTSARSITDVNGVYTIEGLPRGQYQLLFRSGDSLPPLTPEAQKNLPNITVTPGTTVTAPAYAVSRKFRIDGIVKDESGKPVPGAYIAAYGLDRPEWYDGGGLHYNDLLYSDEQGKFTKYLPEPSNEVVVVARKCGLVSRVSEHFKVDGEQSTPITITVFDTGRIVGRVEDSGGSLIANTRFDMRGASATALNVSMGNKSQKTVLRYVGLGSEWTQDGHFYLTNVPADDYRLTFKNAEQLVTVSPGNTVSGVVLSERALGNATLVGHVCCEGMPVPNLQIKLSGKSMSLGERDITSNDDGSFSSSGMLEGEYIAIAQYGSNMNGVRTVRHLDPQFSIPASGTHTFDIEFGQGDSGIEGYVKANGRGIAAELNVRAEWGHRYVENVTVYANEDGYYRITGLPAGKPNLKMVRQNGTTIQNWPIEVETIAGKVIRHDITFGTGTITAACSGVHENVDGRFLVVPGDHDVENLTLLKAYGLLEKAVFDKEVTQDKNFTLKDFPEGTYTVLWATYDAKAETDEARFASTKFTAAIATVESGQETRLQLALP